MCCSPRGSHPTCCRSSGRSRSPAMPPNRRTRGPDMLFVIGSSAAHGKRAGVMASLGIAAGCLLHMTLATIGLSALLAASATAFEVVKWLGAAYLVWVGIGMLRQRRAAVASVVVRARRVF